MTAVTEQIHDIGRRRAWVIWLAALSVYVLAIFNRSSLGVAGLLATERFGITATQLSFFTVLQLVVYAGLQVPIGVLLDRYGSRVLLLGGLALMTARAARLRLRADVRARPCWRGCSSAPATRRSSSA